MATATGPVIRVGARTSPERLSRHCERDLAGWVPLRLVGVGRRPREIAHEAIEMVPFTMLVEDELAMVRPEESVIKDSTAPTKSRKDLENYEWTIRVTRIGDIFLQVEQTFGEGDAPAGMATKRGVAIDVDTGAKIVLKPGVVEYVPVTPST